MDTLRTHWRWPVVAAALPQAAGFRLLARVAATDRVVFPNEADAWAVASRFGYTRLPESGTAPADEMTWRRAWRLVQLVDHADLFLAMTRRATWFERDADIVGAWPRRGPYFALTYHWGAGLGSLGHFARAGQRAHFLSVRFGDADRADAWRWRYMQLRIRATERASGAPVIYTGGATERIAAALDAGTSIVALCDVPATPGRSSISASLDGWRLTIPLGLARLACARAVPVVLFVPGIDRATGRRRLEIDEPRAYSDPSALAAVLAARLATLLVRDAAAWHMWPYAAALLRAAPAP